MQQPVISNPKHHSNSLNSLKQSGSYIYVTIWHFIKVETKKNALTIACRHVNDSPMLRVTLECTHEGEVSIFGDLAYDKRQLEKSSS